MADTVPIGGIKLSGELVQIDLHESSAIGKRLVGLLQRFSSEKIGIPHLHQGITAQNIQTTLCLSVDECSRLPEDVKDLIADDGGRVLPSVGTISLFPHGFDLSFVSKIIHALAQRYIPLHGISTSVSALVLHTDFSLLDEAVGQILTVCQLPQNHTPLRPVIVLGDEEIETVAVYWEEKVRIYGMDILPGLIDVQLDTSVGVCISDNWCEHSSQQNKFRLLSQQAIGLDKLAFNFLVAPEWEQGFLTVMDAIVKYDGDSLLKTTRDVELVAFHGPHFQDRFGIANLALSRLHAGGVRLLRCGCTGTSVHLVVEQGMGSKVVECLRDSFVIPSF